jgi:glycosyltransferase involved in cell wall biosynthesis
LIERGVDPGRIAVVKNGVDTEMFRPDVAPARHPEWDGKFIASYIGTLGMAHAAGTILEAAERLRERRDIHFLLIGNGAERERLLARSRERRLHNVTFLGELPWTIIPSYLALSGAAIVHLSRAALFETVLPSKMFEIMAAARPVLLGVRGEAARVLAEAGAGLAFQPESAEELSRAVERLAADPDLRRRLGQSGRDYVERHASYRQRAADYLAVLGEPVWASAPTGTVSATSRPDSF